MKTLTPKQELFVKHYLVTANVTEAARRAGFKCPASQGNRLMNHMDFKHVQNAVTQAQQERTERLRIDADTILKELWELYQRFKGEIKPQLNSKTGKPIKDEDGNPVYTFSGQQALKALELMGKHMQVKAFDNSLKVDHDDRLIALLQEGRERAHRANSGEDE